MKAELFVKQFLDRLSVHRDLPVPREDLDGAIAAVLDLSVDVPQIRLKNAICIVVEHILGHHQRSYPKRLKEIARKAEQAKRFGPKEFADALMKVCSCDYLEPPRRGEWTSDEALMSAFNCGFSYGLGHAVPTTEGHFVPLQESMIHRFTESLLSGAFTERVMDRIKERDEGRPSGKATLH